MLRELTRETLIHPRRLLARVLAMDWTPALRWQVFAAVVLLSTLVSWLFFMAIDRDGVLTLMLPGPLTLAVANALLLLMLVLAVFSIGRGFGGTAGFGDTLVTISLLQAIMLVVQVVQMVLILVSTLLADLFGLVSLGLLLWLLTNFVMQVHGFRSLLQVAFGLIGALVGLSLLFSLVLVLTGLSGQGV